jgi:hypothetical protein
MHLVPTLLSGTNAVQQEPEDIPTTGAISLAGQETPLPGVAVGADGLGIRTSGGGLNPPVPSSVEPNGIPARPTVDAEPIPLGDDADAAGDPDGVLTMGAQVPDAVPSSPPPSKTVLDADIPAPAELIPEAAVVELPIPGEACESKPPAHVAVTPVAEPRGDAPDAIGLTPGDASSVAPSGIPVGATGEAGPMPSGDVIPSGDGPLPAICADAGLKPNTAVVITMIAARIILASSAMPHLHMLACPHRSNDISGL